MRLSRLVVSGCFSGALLWAAGCGVDGGLTFVPDATFNGSGAAGAGGGAAGQGGGQAAGAGQAGQPAGGSGGKAMFEPKCAACLTAQCPTLLNQCAIDNACVDCVLMPGDPKCASIPAAVALHACACGNCDKPCESLKCPGGMGGAGGGGPGGFGGKAGGPGGGGPGGGGPGGAGGAPPGCGNNKPDPGEECDGALPSGQQTCAAYLGDPTAHGNIFCNGACVVDASDCHTCGDGTANQDEECDSTDLRGKTCESLSKPAGTLSCSQTCKFDVSKCNGTAPACGDGMVQQGEECDGQVDPAVSSCESLLGASYEGQVGCTSCRLDVGSCKRKMGVRHGPPMVELPRANNAGTFSIDSTEVTRGQYEVFLKQLPPAGGFPNFCSFKAWSPASFTPDSGCMAQASVSASGPGSLYKTPVVCVDFCDAFAYCQWAGKTLCGGTTMNPPNAPWDKLDDVNVNAWTSACTANGAAAYPYGPTYVPGQCNDQVLGREEVGARAKCHSVKPGYDALRDMSGNVAEWTDACHPVSPMDECAVRGGDFGASEDALSCVPSNPEYFSRDAVADFIGFRCCEVTGNPPPP